MFSQSTVAELIVDVHGAIASGNLNVTTRKGRDDDAFFRTRHLRLRNQFFQLTLKAAAQKHIPIPLRHKLRFASIWMNWHRMVKRTSRLSCGKWKNLPVSQTCAPALFGLTPGYNCRHARRH
jgi:hypothetical protein